MQECKTGNHLKAPCYALLERFVSLAIGKSPVLASSSQKIRMDNGSELISQRLENWAKEKQIELLHLQPGKPAQNAYIERIERFKRTFREDVLDAYLFDHLDEVREIAELWLEEYNTLRPHEALQGLSPRQFAIQQNA
jgi:putative transposase